MLKLNFRHIIDANKASDDPGEQAEAIALWLENNRDQFGDFEITPEDFRNTSMYFNLSKYVGRLKQYAQRKGIELI